MLWPPFITDDRIDENIIIVRGKCDQIYKIKEKTMNELLSCAFCGEVTARIMVDDHIKYPTNWFCVECSSCNARGAPKSSIEEAAGSWNKRCGYTVLPYKRAVKKYPQELGIKDLCKPKGLKAAADLVKKHNAETERLIKEGNDMKVKGLADVCKDHICENFTKEKKGTLFGMDRSRKAVWDEHVERAAKEYNKNTESQKKEEEKKRNINGNDEGRQRTWQTMTIEDVAKLSSEEYETYKGLLEKQREEERRGLNIPYWAKYMNSKPTWED